MFPSASLNQEPLFPVLTIWHDVQRPTGPSPSRYSFGICEFSGRYGASGIPARSPLCALTACATRSSAEASSAASGVIGLPFISTVPPREMW